MVPGFLYKSGAIVQVSFVLNKAVVQAFLIYRRKIWVITDSMLKVMEGFHHHNI